LIEASVAEGFTSVSLAPDRLNGKALVDAVRRVRADGTFVAASRRCAAEIAAMADAPRVVESSVREWVMRR
jgi:hypothetical protein